MESGDLARHLIRLFLGSPTLEIVRERPHNLSGLVVQRLAPLLPPSSVRTRHLEQRCGYILWTCEVVNRGELELQILARPMRRKEYIVILRSVHYCLRKTYMPVRTKLIAENSCWSLLVYLPLVTLP